VTIPTNNKDKGKTVLTTSILISNFGMTERAETLPDILPRTHIHATATTNCHLLFFWNLQMKNKHKIINRKRTNNYQVMNKGYRNSSSPLIINLFRNTKAMETMK
jgi:hypothetical protein